MTTDPSKAEVVAYMRRTHSGIADTLAHFKPGLIGDEYTRWYNRYAQWWSRRDLGAPNGQSDEARLARRRRARRQAMTVEEPDDRPATREELEGIVRELLDGHRIPSMLACVVEGVPEEQRELDQALVDEVLRRVVKMAADLIEWAVDEAGNNA